MRRRSTVRRRRSQAGFTLIELMVSLVLFSFAIAGVLAIAVSLAQGYREQRQVVETETAARGALDYIADALRMASPGVRLATVTSKTATEIVINPATATTITTAFVEDWMGPAGACPIGTVRVQNGTGLNGSDVLDVVFASGPVVTSVGLVAWDNSSTFANILNVYDAQSLAAGDTLLITDGSTGRLVRVRQVLTATSVELETPTCTKTLPASGGYEVGSLVIRALHARFYLAANPTDGITTALYMDPDADGGLPAEPLADWIEDFQVAVAVDENQDSAITDDEWAFSLAGAGTTFTADGSRNLHAMRVTLVARPPSALVATTPTYYPVTAEDHTPTGGPDTLRRRVLSTTVEIRNLGVSP